MQYSGMVLQHLTEKLGEIGIKDIYCVLFLSVVTCSVPTVSNGSPDKSGTVVYLEKVTYTCQAGYNVSNGNAERTCQSDGALSGTTPTCSSRSYKKKKTHQLKTKVWSANPCLGVVFVRL